MTKPDICIFCAESKSGSRIIFEDASCFVISDKYPSQHGHLLVISKEHHENVLVAPDKLISHMFVVAKNFGEKLKEKFGATGITLITNTGADAGQIIFHLHIHVKPRYHKPVPGFMPHKELTKEEEKRIKEQLGF